MKKCFGRYAAAIAAAIAGLAASAASGQVVISQIWGGGTTTNAAPADTIELHNLGASPVDLSGWSIHLSATSSTTWTRVPIPAGTIPAKGYFLVAVATTTTTNANGTAYDLITSGANDGVLLSSGGKVALVDSSNSGTLTGASPIGTTGTYPPSATAGIVDFVGYGTTANARENTTLPGATSNNAPANSFTGPTAIIRRGTRCSDNGTPPDTNVNSADWVTTVHSVSTPIVWRNSLTSALGGNFASATATANVPVGGSLTVSGSAKQCATGTPDIIATSATVDLTSIGLSSAEVLTSSDGGLTWSGTFAVPSGASEGLKNALVTFVTGSGNATGNVSFTVNPGNDTCATVFALTSGPFVISSLPATITGSNVNATAEAGTALGSCQTSTGSATNPANNRDVYYKFTPGADGLYSFTLCGGTVFDTVMSIHSGCPVSAANQVVCNNDGLCGGATNLSAIDDAFLTGSTPYVIRIATIGAAGVGNTFTLRADNTSLGACCSSTGFCTFTTSAQCTTLGGTFDSGATTCNSTTVCPAPANDTCAGAALISSIPYTSPTFQLVNATADQDITCNSGTVATTQGVWFTYTPSVSCNVTINRTLAGASTDSVGAIFSGDCSTLTEVACADAESQTATLNAGTQYYILVGRWSATAATTSMTLTLSIPTCVPLAPPPANDTCGGAIAVASVPYTSPAIDISGSTADANLACNTSGTSEVRGGIWFTYTAASDCTLRVGETSAVNAIIGVYTGTCAGLTEVACSTSEAAPGFAATAGTQYYILVGVEGLAFPGSVQPVVTIDCIPAPANDNCSGATVITSVPFSPGTESIDAASNDVDALITDPSCNQTSATVNQGLWYTYTPASNGFLSIREQSSLDSVMAVFSGTCAGLTQLGCSDGTPVTGDEFFNSVLVSAGTQYYILVGDWGTTPPAAGAVVQVTIDLIVPPPAPSNDDCTAATVVSSLPFSSGAVQIGSATNDLNVSCNTGGATDVSAGIWFTYTPSAQCLLSVVESGSLDTIIGVFTGTCGSLSEVQCSTTDTSPNFTAAAGTQYYILVGVQALGLPGPTGSVTVAINCAPTATNDDCTTAKVITGDGYTDSYAAVSATGDIDVACNSGSVANNSAWYTYTPTVNSLATLSETGTLDTVVAAFTGTCGSLTEIGCTDTPETLNLTLTAGTQYYFLTGIWSSAASTSTTAIAVSFTVGPVPPAPSNDTCTGATLISSLPFNSGNIANAGATSDTNGTCNTSGTTQVNNGIWFTYTPTSNCNLFLSETTTQDAVFVVFIGDCSFPLEAYCTAAETDNGTFAASAGTQYFILVGRQGLTNAGLSDNLNFSLDCLAPPTAPPANDDCANATVVTSIPFDSGSILAFLGTDDADITCNTTTATAANKGVWFSFTPSTPCILSLAETGPLDTAITIYTGSCGSLTQVACSDPESFSFSTTTGTQYYILVSRWATTALGTFDSYRLTLNCLTPITNDTCGSAVNLNGNLPYSFAIDTSTAANEGANPPQGSCDAFFIAPSEGVDNSVYYTFTPASNGAFGFNVNSTYDLIALVYTGACGSLTEVGCFGEPDQPLNTTFNMVGGTTYTIVLGDEGSSDLGGATTGTFTFTPVVTNSVCCRGTTSILTTSAACTAPAGVGVAFLSGNTTVNGTSNTSPCCYADFNKDGSRNIDDIFIYLNAWFGVASNPFAKVNGDGVTNANIDDLFVFINVWFAAGCG